MLRKILSSILILLTLGSSFAIWFFIEVYYKGCCGARYSGENDGVALLTHLISYAVALGLIWFSIWWGWRKPKIGILSRDTVSK